MLYGLCYALFTVPKVVFLVLLPGKLQIRPIFFFVKIRVFGKLFSVVRPAVFALVLSIICIVLSALFLPARFTLISIAVRGVRASIELP